jgi:hypothetical protein
MTDARFQDAEKPLRLAAETPEDVPVLSAVLQDAVGQIGEATWQRRRRRFVAVLNRFRWEDREAAERAGRPFERVRAVLSVEHVLSVKARGVRLGDPAAAFCLLAVGYEPGADGAATLRLTLAGGGDVAVAVEALEATLTDVTRPHVARGLPRHDV